MLQKEVVVAEGAAGCISGRVNGEMGRVLEDGVIIAVKEVRLDGLESRGEGGEVEGFLAGLLDDIEDIWKSFEKLVRLTFPDFFVPSACKNRKKKVGPTLIRTVAKDSLQRLL